MRQVNARPDPAPSKWSYRYQRIMLTPVYRRLLRVGLPLAACLMAVTVFLADQGRRDAIYDWADGIRQDIQTRPEFLIRVVEIDGASDQLDRIIRGRFPYDLPVSSFDLELDAFRGAVESIPAVASTSVRVQRGGVLSISVTERTPVALWRSRNGLTALDATGVSIANMRSRMDAPGLPVLAGDGGNQAVPEALALLAAADPIRDRIRGLERMAARRWDVVLDRDQRILLPEQDPVSALERVIALNEAGDLFARDVVAVDLRLPDRPTVRMQPRAVEAWRGVAEVANMTGSQ